jgi:hypothetical protein
MNRRMGWIRWGWLALLAGLCACGAGSQLRSDETGASLVTIRGLLTVADRNRFQLTACDGNARFTLGDMSAGNAHFLQRRFRELSRRTPGPVTAEVAGQVRKNGKGYEVERPALIYIASGRCVEPEEGGLDY